MAYKRKTMTALEMAKELQKRGYAVKFIVRAEGSIRITKINGKSFKGSAGNIEARNILGQRLTESQEKRLAKIKQKKGVFGKKRLRGDWKELQKKANEAFKKDKKSARVTYNKIMYRLEHEGEAETKMYLERAVNYALGYVFDDALEAFKQRLTHDNAVRKSELVDEIIATLDDIIISGKHLKDADFKDAIALTYEWEGGKISTETWHANIKIILDKAE